MKQIRIAALAVFASVVCAQAETYPSNPITIVIPLPAGGAVDTMVRTLAEPMRATLGQPILVENVGGAGGTTGINRVARSAPDGYTISVGTWGTHVVNAFAYATPYDLARDLQAVALLPSVPHWFIARKNLPPTNLKELIAYLKANDGKVTSGSVGPAGSSAICAYYFGKITGAKTTLVPYRGGAPALQDIVAGNIDMMCDLAANSLSQVRAGTIKAYAVTAKKRWFAAPDVPTVDEAGAPGRRGHQLAWRLCAERRTEGRHRQTQRRVQQGDGRSGCTEADRRPGHEFAAPGIPVPGGVRRLSEIGNGQVGRGHPRVGYQGAVTEREMRSLPAVVSIFLAAAISSTAAQTWPTHPITIVAPTTAGGPPDTIARILSEPMKSSLGQPVIVENVTGAGGSLGVQRVVRSAPDGYTVSIGHLNSHVFTGAVYNLSFDLLTDLAPVTMLTAAPMVFVVRSGFPADSLKELIAWMKQHPKGATFGSVGIGGPAKVWATDFQRKVGIEFQFVPYRGAAAIVQDLIAGQIDVACVEGSNVLAHLHGGKIKPYAVLSPKRWVLAADVPTIDEAGGPKSYMTFWHGLWVPKGTPQDIVAKLDAAAVYALADANTRARLAQIGQDIVPREQQTPQALAAHQKAEIAKWWPIIRAAGVKAE